MPEMILPGTYIEVRDEGLIVPGPISIGNLGIVGTAARGRLNTVYTPGNLGDARDIFDQYDAFSHPRTPDHPLTLIRALELAYANGASRVFAVRVAAGGGVQAVYSFNDTTGTVNLTSVAPTAGYSRYEMATGADVGGNVDVTITLNGMAVEAWRDVPRAWADFVDVINGDHATYNYGTNASTGGGSNLFTAAASSAAPGDVNPDQTLTAPTTLGTDGADALQSDYEAGLAALLNENVHVVVQAGQAFSTTLRAHVENASTDVLKRDRIGVIGSDPSSAVANLTAPDQLQGRLVFVGPGVRAFDAAARKEVTLPGTYAAAAVAGRITSLEPHISPTNKTLNVAGLETVFNGTQLEQLVLGHVLALEQRNGSVRIVRGMTSSTNTAWTQITTRRIVDFAKFGVRAAANPFIGKLNNARVRAALQGSINSFMADMVDREMLVSYELEVTATRAQEIRGIAQVTMVVRPTFSIDHIRVVMYLE